MQPPQLCDSGERVTFNCNGRCDDQIPTFLVVVWHLYHCCLTDIVLIILLFSCWYYADDIVLIMCLSEIVLLIILLLSCRPLLSPPVSSPPSSSFSCPLCLFWHQLQRKTNWIWPSYKRKSKAMVAFSLRWLSVQSTWSWPCSGTFSPLDFLIRWFLPTLFDQVVCVNFFQLLGTMRGNLALPWPS